MKAIKIVFYSLLGGVLLGGLLSGVRAFYIIFFIQLGVLVLSTSLSLWTVLHFSFTQTVDKEQAIKGDTVTLNLSIHNDMPYPFTMMRVFVTAVSASESSSFPFHLAPRDHIEFHPEFHCAFRGSYQIGMSYVEIQDVFGLTRLHFNLLRLPYYRQRTILIYPRVHELGSLTSHAADEKNFDGTNLRLVSSGDSFAGVRQYLPGDAQKRIHWKASAKQQKLYTRLYELSSETHCLVCIDSNSHKLLGEQALRNEDMLCEAAVTILYYALSHAHAVLLQKAKLGEKPIRAQSINDFRRLHKWLALMEFEQGTVEDPEDKCILSALTQQHDIDSAYLLTLGNGQRLCDHIGAAGLPYASITVIEIAETSKCTQQAYENIRLITISPTDNVASVLEESL